MWSSRLINGSVGRLRADSETTKSHVIVSISGSPGLVSMMSLNGYGCAEKGTRCGRNGPTFFFH